MKLWSARRTIFTTVLITITCIALFAWGGDRFASNDDVLHDLEVFAKVIEKIRSYYVDDVDTHELINTAIEEMLQDLDPHSQFLEGLEYEDLMVSTRGEFGGLGIFIAFRDDYPTVISPIEGTPAHRAGMRGGDQIVGIGDISTKGWRTQKAVELLRGEPGTEVTFTVNRPGLTDPVEYTLTREIITVKSVPFYGIFEDKGYIKVSSFSKQTRDELEDALKSLEEEGMEALILDLRTNPGGLLQAATEVTELFLERDRLIVYTKGRLSNSNQKYYSGSTRIHEGYPIVVMLNFASASASEIFAGALQDWDAAVLVGQTSFGKGTVQTVFSLSETEAVKLTTAKYYTPSGRNIHKDHPKGGTGEPETANVHPESDTGTGTVVIEGAESETTADVKEEKPIFYTSSGRVVYGGGGITPDLEFELETYTDLQRKFEREAVFFEFAVEFSKSNSIPMDFRVTDQIFQQFKAFLAEKEVEYDEEELAKEENLVYLKAAIARDVVSSKFGRQAMYRVVLEQDTELQRVLSILAEAPTLSELFKYVEAQKSLKEARIE
jgi:carboxyl-terminal processing protease